MCLAHVSSETVYISKPYYSVVIKMFKEHTRKKWKTDGCLQYASLLPINIFITMVATINTYYWNDACKDKGIKNAWESLLLILYEQLHVICVLTYWIRAKIYLVQYLEIDLSTELKDKRVRFSFPQCLLLAFDYQMYAASESRKDLIKKIKLFANLLSVVHLNMISNIPNVNIDFNGWKKGTISSPDSKNNDSMHCWTSQWIAEF